MKSIGITTLLSLVSEILLSLRIRYSQLLALQDVYVGKINYLKYLDISVDEHGFEEHSFDKKDIIAISKLVS